MKSHRPLFFTLGLMTLVGFLLPVNGSAAPLAQSDDFGQRLVAAVDSGDQARLQALLQHSRMQVKPAVDQLLSESIRDELSGRASEARHKRALAEAVAETFEDLFGERSLTLGVAYLSSWSKQQMAEKLRADSLYASGTRLRRKKDTRDPALADYRQALDMYNAIGDQRGAGSTLGGIGFVYWYKDADQALAYFRQALKVRQEVDDRQLVGNSYNDLGSVYWRFFRDYPKALQYHRKAAEVREEIGDQAGLGKSLGNIGLAYWDLGELQKAFEYYDRAAAIHTQLGDDNRAASALYNCGILLTDLGRLPTALDYLERSLDIRERHGDPRRIGSVLNRMGIVYRRLGEFESAVESYRRVIEIMEEAGDEKGLANGLMNLGVVLQNLNRPERAAGQYERSLALFEKAGNPNGVLAALNNLGSVYFDLHDYAKAEGPIRKALDMSREFEDREGQVNNLTTLANVQNFQGKLDSALANYKVALQIAEKLNSPALIWPVLLGLGDNYERQGDTGKALQTYARAFDLVEGVRGSMQSESYKASFLAQKRFAYEAVIHLLAKLHAADPSAGYDRQAFVFAERAKARAFLDLLAEALADVREGMDPELLQKQEALLSELAQTQQVLQQESAKADAAPDSIAVLKTGVNELDMQYRTLQREISRSNPRYAALHHPQPITLEGLQSDVLDKNTLVLEYSLGDSSSSLWVVSQNSRQLYRLPDRQTLRDQVDLVRASLSNPQASTPEFFAKSSYRLYQLVLEPAALAIPRGKNLVVIPDGELNYLPFEALITRRVEGGSVDSYSELPYLVKRNPISYSQSASVLRSLILERDRRDQHARKAFVAFGDPIFAEEEPAEAKELRTSKEPFVDSQRAGLARLKYSGIEVERIARLFPAGQAETFLRGQASEEEVKQGALADYRYVHFATHGLINDRKPDFSSIVLTQDRDPNEDGYLHGAEIFNLKMDADLVVLSACQTGLGKMVRGEGLVGLTRAFMYAGSRSMLVSLWSVSDISTSELMEKFYENLVVRRISKTEALRQAQISMIGSDKFAHPFYWAPFVLVGDWD